MTEEQILHRFYTSAAFRKLSYFVKVKSNGICADCGKTVPYSEMRCHHVIPLNAGNVNDVNIALSERNLVAICHDCHNKRHGRFGAKKPKNVYIVYGAPCSGKSTTVRELMNSEDIVWDFDSIRKAVAESRYGEAEGAKDLIFQLRKTFFQFVKDRAGKWENAYIIGGYPSRSERENLARELRATLLFVDTEQEDCLRRLESDEERKTERDRFIFYIKEWFETFERTGKQSPPDIAFV